MKYNNIDLSTAEWRKSSFSGGGNDCVEVASVNGRFAVRDSKNHAAGVLIFDTAEWDAFRAGVSAGEFDS